MEVFKHGKDHSITGQVDLFQIILWCRKGPVEWLDQGADMNLTQIRVFLKLKCLTDHTALQLSESLIPGSGKEKLGVYNTAGVVREAGLD